MPSQQSVPELVECQRHWGVTWGAPIPQIDWPPWCDPAGLPVTLTRFPSMDGEGGWFMVRTAGTDDDGWRYGTTCTSVLHPRPGGRSTKRASDQIRCRTWRRVQTVEKDVLPLVINAAERLHRAQQQPQGVAAAASAGPQGSSNASAAAASAPVPNSGVNGNQAPSGLVVPSADSAPATLTPTKPSVLKLLQVLYELWNDSCTRHGMRKVLPLDPVGMFLASKEHAQLLEVQKRSQLQLPHRLIACVPLSNSPPASPSQDTAAAAAAAAAAAGGSGGGSAAAGAAAPTAASEALRRAVEAMTVPVDAAYAPLMLQPPPRQAGQQDGGGQDGAAAASAAAAGPSSSSAKMQDTNGRGGGAASAQDHRHHNHHHATDKVAHSRGSWSSRQHQHPDGTARPAERRHGGTIEQGQRDKRMRGEVAAKRHGRGSHGPSPYQAREHPFRVKLDGPDDQFDVMCELLAACNYSRSAYGYVLLAGYLSSFSKLMGMASMSAYFDPVAGASVEANNEAIHCLTGVPPEDILMCEWRSTVFRPCHYLLVDRERHQLVLAVRGSLEMSDITTDLTAAPLQMRFGDLQGHVHEGLMSAATYVHVSVSPALQKAVEEHPGWPLLVTGHSLGGGVAGLLALLLRQAGTAPPGMGPVRGVCVAPAAVMDSVLADSCRDYCLSLVLNADFVPRLSFFSVERALIDLVTFSPAHQVTNSLIQGTADTWNAISASIRGVSAALGQDDTPQEEAIRQMAEVEMAERRARRAASRSGKSMTGRQQQQAPAPSSDSDDEGVMTWEKLRSNFIMSVFGDDGANAEDADASTSSARERALDAPAGREAMARGAGTSHPSQYHRQGRSPDGRHGSTSRPGGTSRPGSTSVPAGSGGDTSQPVSARAVVERAADASDAAAASGDVGAPLDDRDRQRSGMFAGSPDCKRDHVMKCDQHNDSNSNNDGGRGGRGRSFSSKKGAAGAQVGAAPAVTPLPADGVKAVAAAPPPSKRRGAAEEVVVDQAAEMASNMPRGPKELYPPGRILWMMTALEGAATAEAREEGIAATARDEGARPAAGEARAWEHTQAVAEGNAAPATASPASAADGATRGHDEQAPAALGTRQTPTAAAAAAAAASPDTAVDWEFEGSPSTSRQPSASATGNPAGAAAQAAPAALSSWFDVSAAMDFFSNSIAGTPTTPTAPLPAHSASTTPGGGTAPLLTQGVADGNPEGGTTSGTTSGSPTVPPALFVDPLGAVTQGVHHMGRDNQAPDDVPTVPGAAASTATAMLVDEGPASGDQHGGGVGHVRFSPSTRGVAVPSPGDAKVGGAPSSTLLSPSSVLMRVTSQSEDGRACGAAGGTGGTGELLGWTPWSGGTAASPSAGRISDGGSAGMRTFLGANGGAGDKARGASAGGAGGGATAAAAAVSSEASGIFKPANIAQKFTDGFRKIKDTVLSGAALLGGDGNAGPRRCIYLLEADKECFQSLLLVPNCVNEHIPDEYYQALCQLASGLGVPLPVVLPIKDHRADGAS